MQKVLYKPIPPPIAMATLEVSQQNSNGVVVKVLFLRKCKSTADVEMEIESCDLKRLVGESCSGEKAILTLAANWRSYSLELLSSQ